MTRSKKVNFTVLGDSPFKTTYSSYSNQAFGLVSKTPIPFSIGCSFRSLFKPGRGFSLHHSNSQWTVMNQRALCGVLVHRCSRLSFVPMVLTGQLKKKTNTKPHVKRTPHPVMVWNQNLVNESLMRTLAHRWLLLPFTVPEVKKFTSSPTNRSYECTNFLCSPSRFCVCSASPIPARLCLKGS